MKSDGEEITFFRLVTGEDLIASSIKVKKDGFDDDHYILTNPLKVIYITNPQSKMKLNISLMQWIFERISDSQEFKIYKTDIITTAIPSISLSEYYNDAVEHMKGYVSDVVDEEFIDEDTYQEPGESELHSSSESDSFEHMKDILTSMILRNKKVLH